MAHHVEITTKHCQQEQNRRHNVHRQHFLRMSGFRFPGRNISADKITAF